MIPRTSFPASPSRHAALAFALVLAPLAGCGGGAGGEAEAADAPLAATPRDTATLAPESVQLAGLELAPAESLAWRESWSVPARLVLDPSATHALGAVAGGRVTRVLVRPGDTVAAGQPLVAIRSHELTDVESEVAVATAAVAEAETALGVARSAAARAGRLHEIRALSLADLERARGELAQAEARRTQAGASLGRARALRDALGGSTEGGEVLVRSPIAGVVVSRDAQPGAVVLVGAPLVTVSRTSSLYLTLRLPERAMGAARVGSPVRFAVTAFPGERFEARVTRVAPVLDSLTRTLEVEARVADGTGGVTGLRAEMFATAELMGPEGERTLVVPAGAVQSFAGDTVVVVAREGGSGATEGGTMLEAVRVRVGRRTAEKAEIVAGLDAGTMVVTRGAAVAKAEILRRREGE